MEELTRIPYTGDLASVQVALGHPGKTVNAPTSPSLRIDGPEEADYPGEPIFATGTSTVIGYQKVVRLPKFEGRTYRLWVEKEDREHLIYTIVRMGASGFYEIEGEFEIRVDGTHAIIRGGNDAVLDFLSLKLRSDHPTTTTPK